MSCHIGLICFNGWCIPQKFDQLLSKNLMPLCVSSTYDVVLCVGVPCVHPLTAHLSLNILKISFNIWMLHKNFLHTITHILTFSINLEESSKSFTEVTRSCRLLRSTLKTRVNLVHNDLHDFYPKSLFPVSHKLLLAA